MSLSRCHIYILYIYNIYISVYTVPCSIKRRFFFNTKKKVGRSRAKKGIFVGENVVVLHRTGLLR